MAHKILVVDDDRINIALVKFTLAEQRYDVVVAFDGDDGLEQVKKESPDLIILDVQMPRMNGYDFMTELKQRQGTQLTPVLMLTANETMQDVFKLEGVKGYFVKPVDQQKLRAAIIQCLGPNPF